MRDARSYNLISRGIAQLVEQWSPKPRAEGSSPSAPAKSESLRNGLHKPFLGLFLSCISVKTARHVVCESPFDAQNEHQFVPTGTNNSNDSVRYSIKIASVFACYLRCEKGFPKRTIYTTPFSVLWSFALSLFTA